MTARVRIENASDPASASVRQNAAIHSPHATFGRTRAFIASSAEIKMGSVPRAMAPYVVETPRQAFESSSVTRQRSIMLPPRPPCSSGTNTPMRPASPIVFTMSRGKISSASSLARTGRISPSAIFLVSATISFWVSVRKWSIAPPE